MVAHGLSIAHPLWGFAHGRLASRYRLLQRGQDFCVTALPPPNLCKAAQNLAAQMLVPRL
jgi:hypothetical protein